MFVVLLIAGFIGALYMFIGWALADFQSTEYLTSFLSLAFSTVLCYKLLSLETKANKNEAEIKRLKNLNGLNDDDKDEE
ncbi:MAG: hypothetical protein IJV85_01235 [Clostridia bacterium]|nr:hypothetical protein [Clostridia bacterium]